MRTPTRSLPTLALAALALLACGGDGGTPPPAPPVPVASIQYSVDSALVFTGGTIAVRDLVRAYDADGHELPSSRLALTLPAGWTQRGDSLDAPSAEAVGELRAAAEDGDAYRGVSLDVAAGEGTAVTTSIDLRGYTWTASWSCVGGSFRTSEGAAIDSIQMDAVTVDSAVYSADAGWIPNFGGVAQLWYTGPMIRFLEGDVVDTVAAVVDQVVVRWQGVGELSIGNAAGLDEGPLVKVSGPGEPLTYTGPSLCRKEWTGDNGETTLVGVKDSGQ